MGKWNVGSVVKQKPRKDSLAWQLSIRYTIVKVTDKQISFVNNDNDGLNKWVYTYDVNKFEKYLEMA